MSRSAVRELIPFLLLLFCGTICAAMVVPYMGFFLVEGLGRDPWVISVYSFLAASLTIGVNRIFARRIDAGDRVFPLIGVAAGGYFLASTALTVSPTLWTVLILGVLGFGVSSSAVSTMFSVGGSLAEGKGIDRQKFNAYMRATTSTAWMVGPAVAFLVADQVGVTWVFKLGLGVSVLWILLWLWAVPRDAAAPPKPVSGPEGGTGSNRGLWLAAAFVSCLSIAHSLTFTALPLFYVREVGLPGFAPGTAFSVKTFVEVIAIFSTPFLIARFGLRMSLIGTSILAVLAIQVLASVQSFPHMLGAAAIEGLYYGLYASLGISYVQSFAPDRPAMATATYWNTLIVTGILAGPAAGLIAQAFSFGAVIHVASVVAAVAVAILVLGGRAAPERAEKVA